MAAKSGQLSKWRMSLEEWLEVRDD